MSPETPDPAAIPVPPVAATPAPSPGAMIREARDRMRWSIDDLAGQTKLARHTLEALERDDFGALLEPVYVRGYYRKCAKVLEMKETALLTAYESRVAPKTQAPPAKLRLASGTELGSSSRVPVALAIGLAVIGVVACALFWLARTPAPQPTTTTLELSSPVEAEADNGAQETPVESLDAAPVETIVAAPTPAPEVAPAIGTAAADPRPITPDAAAPAAAGTAAPEVAAGGSGAALLRFESESWVRINDASGKTLINRLIPAGSERRVGGALPLSVFLGNAPGVIVEFQGGPVDLAPYQRDNATARFTLPLTAPTP